MTEALKIIGELLKATREARGLDLTDIAGVLKIRRLYLDAIEKGDPAELPGLVYFAGYLKNYADMLGLDSTELLGQYQGYLQALQNPLPKKVKEPQSKSGRDIVQLHLPNLHLPHFSGKCPDIQGKK